LIYEDYLVTIVMIMTMMMMMAGYCVINHACSDKSMTLLADVRVKNTGDERKGGVVEGEGEEGEEE